jgi:hypothetical protein
MLPRPKCSEGIIENCEQQHSAAVRCRRVLVGTVVLALISILAMLSIAADAAPEEPRKGVAVSNWGTFPVDNELIGATWAYLWGDFSPENFNWGVEVVPMIGRKPYWPSELLPKKDCHDTMTFLNEPNSFEPYGGPVLALDAKGAIVKDAYGNPVNSPQRAAHLLIALEDTCPDSEIVAFNFVVDHMGHAVKNGAYNGWGVEYLSVALSAYENERGRPYEGIVGAHCYTWNTAGYCLEKLAEVRQVWGGELWITEFNCVYCSPQEFERLLVFIDHLVGPEGRYAAYTPRAGKYALAQGWVAFDLVKNGYLTPNGQVFANYGTPWYLHSDVRVSWAAGRAQ